MVCVTLDAVPSLSILMCPLKKGGAGGEQTGEEVEKLKGKLKPLRSYPR